MFPFAIPYRPFVTFPFRLLKIIRFLKKHEFDIIHSWHWSSDFSEPLAAKLAGIPFVFTKKSMGWGNKAWKWRSALSTKIIAINSDMKFFFKGKLEAKTVQIPLGVDTHFYQAQEKKYITPEGLTFQKDDFVIISVVNLIPVKGIEVLIEAVNALNNPNIKLCIVGNTKGAYAEQLQLLAKSNKNIHFLGNKLDVRPYHAVADLFVIPTLALGEGLPVAPIEAMASERIVIGSNVPGVKDVLAKFPTCLFKPNNVEDLKRLILDQLNLTPTKKISLQKEMRNHVLANYSNKQFMQRHEQLYKALVK
jgi:glycosyltransferase involved in cell wall biosynthesis